MDFFGNGHSLNNVVDLTEKILHKEVYHLRNDMTKFAISLKNELLKAFEEYIAQPSYNIDMLELLNESESAFNAFLDWFIFDYKNDDGVTPFEKFIKIKRHKFGDVTLNMLEKWKEASISAFEVKKVIIEKGIILRNIFTAKESVLLISNYPKDIKVGDIQICRLLPVKNSYEFLLGTYVMDKSYKDLIIKRVVDAYEGKEKKAFRHEDCEKFLKSSGKILLEVAYEFLYEKLHQEQTLEILDNCLLRNWLTKPLPELNYLSPLKASWMPNKRKKLQTLLIQIETETYRGLKDLPEVVINNTEQIRLLLGLLEWYKVKGFKDFLWDKPEYQKEAKLIEKNMKKEYLPFETEEALEIWYEYSKKTQPIIRKEGVWAAATEYAVSYLNYITEKTQKNIASKYNVSANTVSTNYIKLLQRLENNHF